MPDLPVLTHLRRQAHMATLTAGLVTAKDGYRCVGCGAVLVRHDDTRPPDEQIVAVDEHKCEVTHDRI